MPRRTHWYPTAGSFRFSIAFLSRAYSISPQNEYLLVCILPFSNHFVTKSAWLLKRAAKHPEHSLHQHLVQQTGAQGAESSFTSCFSWCFYFSLIQVLKFEGKWETADVLSMTWSQTVEKQRKQLFFLDITVWEANVTECGDQGKVGKERGAKKSEKSKTLPSESGRTNWESVKLRKRLYLCVNS